MNEALNRARLSLRGLSIGDAFGEQFFAPADEALDRIARRVLPDPPWPYTDDTELALGIFEELESRGAIDEDALAAVFARRYRAQPGRGYGGTTRGLLIKLGEGEDWRTLSPGLFDGMGSMGNGAAMRVAPLGAFFADESDERILVEARASARLTHAHEEGQAGAVAVAQAAAWIVRRRALNETWSGLNFLEDVARATPASDTASKIAKAASIPFEYRVATAVSALGNGLKLLAQDTVPFALWCVARHLNDGYEAALWTTVSGLGDRDTTCAIAGGLMALAVGEGGVPERWDAAREALSLGA